MTTVVVLRDMRDAGDSRRLTASIQPGGCLVIEGQDLGQRVEEIFGAREYEWTWTVRTEGCERLRAALGKTDLLGALAERFSGEKAADLKAFLDSSDVPFEQWSRVGD